LESAKIREAVSRDLFPWWSISGTTNSWEPEHPRLLLRVLQDQCNISAAEEMATKKVASSSLENPSDPDAGYVKEIS
jgi:hypothetical protein